MKKYLPYISLCFIILSLVFLFLFRQTPKGELWKGYSVLYVPENTDDGFIKDTLHQFDIIDFTCLSEQYVPTLFKNDSAEISLLKFNSNAAEYLNKRVNYFFDKSHSYKLITFP